MEIGFEEALNAYEKGIEDLIGSRGALLQAQFALLEKDRPRIEALLEEVMPISRALKADLKHEEKEFRDVGHEIHVLIHFLRDKGFFKKKTLQAHLVSLSDVVHRLKRHMRQLENAKDKEAKDLALSYIADIEGKLREAKKELTDDIGKAHALFEEIRKEFASYMGFSDKWELLLCRIYPSRSSHIQILNTNLQSAMQGNATILATISNELQAELRHAEDDLTTLIGTVSLLLEKKSAGRNTPETVLFRLIERLQHLEDRIFIDLLPRLYSYEKMDTKSRGKRIVHLQGVILEATMRVYRTIQQDALRNHH